MRKEGKGQEQKGNIASCSLHKGHKAKAKKKEEMIFMPVKKYRTKAKAIKNPKGFKLSEIDKTNRGVTLIYKSKKKK